MDARLNGGVAQLGEHLPCKQGVKSSNLSVSTSEMKISLTELNDRACKCWYVKTTFCHPDSFAAYNQVISLILASKLTAE